MNEKRAFKLLDDYLKIQEQLYDHFGYKENYRAIPINDCREYYWSIQKNKEGGGNIVYSDKPEKLISDDGDYYKVRIYTQRHLDTWLYHSTFEFTMICIDTHVDDNKFLSIFDNKKEIKTGGVYNE
jgi:hypothetical protein